MVQYKQTFWVQTEELRPIELSLETEGRSGDMYPVTLPGWESGLRCEDVEGPSCCDFTEAQAKAR